MSLLGIYLGLVVAGESLMYLGAIQMDKISEAYSIAVSMSLLIGVFIFAWPLAVKIDDRWFGK